MKSYHDHSRILDDKECVYPGDPSFDLNEVKTLANDGFSDFEIHGGMHVGTHIDAPAHFIESGKLISDFPINKFVGKAICFDVRGIQQIGMNDIQLDLIKHEKIVIFYTGFDQYYGSEKYYEKHPVISEELATLIVQKKINIVGMDIPSPDYTPYPIHQILLQNEVLLLENLINLNNVPLGKSLDFWAFPAPLKASAAWIRVVMEY